MVDRGYGYDIDLVRHIELEQVKSQDIVAYMAYCGYVPVRTTYKIAWFYAPYRKEEVPSLAVYYVKKPYQDWYDYGDKKGGSIIDLAMALHGVGYVEAVKVLRKWAGCEYLKPKKE